MFILKQVARTITALILFSLAIQPAHALSVNFSYDDTGRLLNIAYDNASIDYEYDNVGNRVSTVFSTNITINNDIPIVNADSLTMEEDTLGLIDVLANDIDTDVLTITAIQSRIGANTVVTSGNRIQYAPPLNFFGKDHLTYEVSDGNGGVATGNLIITVTPVADIPIVQNDSFAVNEDTKIRLDVLNNDIDPDQNGLTINNYRPPLNGVITLNSNNTFSYKPNNNFVGTDEFTYTAQNTTGTSAAIVSITVNNLSEGPVAVSDEFHIDDSKTATFDVLENDYDPEGGVLSIVRIGTVSQGTVVLNPDNTISFTPAVTGEVTKYILSYYVANSIGYTTIGQAAINVTPMNVKPEAFNDSVQAYSDVITNINALGNDFDPNGETLLVQDIVSQPTNGTVAISSTNDYFIYTPNPAFQGSDDFAYNITDGTHVSNTARVAIDVRPNTSGFNLIANDDHFVVNEGASISFNPEVNDLHVGTNADYPAIESRYWSSPPTGFDLDTFTAGSDEANITKSAYYTIQTSTGSSSAYVNVTIKNVNDAPVASNDSATVYYSKPILISVLDNDTDIDIQLNHDPADKLSVTSVGSATNGTTAINAKGQVEYIPNANFKNGSDSFTYTIQDAYGLSANATVSVTVDIKENTAPIANNDSVTLDENKSILISLLANDTDVDNDILSVSSVTQGTQGAVTLNSNHTARYTPSENFIGGDNFKYTINDGNGGSSTATVTVSVIDVNDPPVAQNDSVFTLPNTAVGINVLSNDSDKDGDTLSVTNVTTAANGGVVINPDNTISYTPAQDFTGLDNFNYTINDGRGLSATATVMVDVNINNDAPVANADSVSTNEDNPVTISVLANDTDADGDTLSVSSSTQTANGSTIVNPDNTIVYTPNINFNGNDSFSYTISDGRGGSATANVSVSVTAVNDAPIASDDVDSTNEDVAINIAVLSNDTDAENDNLIVSIITQSANGAVQINPDNSIAYTPDNNYFGQDNFDYQIDDGNGGTSIATVIIDVAAVNDLPVANAGPAQTVEEETIVSLDGSASTDVDGSIVEYTWVQMSGIAVTLSDFSAVTPSFTAPAVIVNEVLIFQLTVTDDNNAIDTATIQVTVTPAALAQEYYVLNPQINNRSLNVVSLGDNNTITAGNTTLVLNMNQSGSIPTGDLAQGTLISGTGSFDVGSDENGTDMLVPAQFASTAFVIPHYRSSHTYYLLSPNVDATATITLNGTPSTVNLIAGVVTSFNAGSDNTISGIVTADVAILVSHTSGTNDVYAVPPATTELVGIRTNNVYVGALEDNTSLTITTSSGASQSYSMNRGDRLNPTIGSSGSEGAGNAYHIVADKLMAAVQGADSDGSEETAFWSPDYFATHYALPINAQYIAVTCLSANTTVTLVDSGTQTQVCDSDGITPGKVYFGSTSDGVRINAGAVLESTNPIYVMYEAASPNDEHNLFGNVTPYSNVLTNNAVPVANAGTDLSITENSDVSLDGTASNDADGSIASYSRIQPAGPGITIIGANTTTPSFTAPEVTADIVLSFALIVTDNEGATSAQDIINVTVQNVNLLPIADAGVNQTVADNSSVTLNGGASNDPDGSIASYSWLQSSGLSVVLSNSTTVSPSFTSPNVSADTLLTFDLVVTDNDGGDSIQDSVVVTVQNNNQAPIANAGTDIDANENVVVNLSGVASTDIDGSIVNYSWAQSAGQSVVLNNTSSATPSFTAPNVSEDITLAFSLIVTDNDGSNSIQDDVIVTIQNVNQLPVANAGADLSVSENTLVNLTGAGSSDSDGSIVTYAWSQITGSAIVLSSTSSVNPSFTAPSVSADTVFTFALIVTDNDSGNSLQDSVNITVQNVNQLPTANAGRDFSVADNSLVTLNGGASSDPDGSIASYSWAQTAGQSVTLSNAASATPSFTAPNVSVDTLLVFALTVIDNDGGSSTQDGVIVTVQNINQLPVVNAGSDIFVDENLIVTLDGTASSDADGSITTYAWTQTAGQSVTLNNASTATPNFTAPNVTVDMLITFTLVVTDNDGVDSLQDSVNVTVQNVNQLPTANAGVDFSVADNTLVTLSGSASNDADGNIASYNWTQASGLSVTLNAANSVSPNFTAPNVSADTQLTFDLVVTDNDGGNSIQDSVVVTVQNNNQLPIANAGVDFSVADNISVILDGGASTDTDGSIVTYAWTQTSGPVVTLSNAFTVMASFNSPNVSIDTLVSFDLSVTDNDGASTQDTVVVTINNVNQLPVADAGIDQTVEEETVVTLNGSSSFDNDGSVVEFTWIQLSGIVATLSDFAAQSPTFTAPVVTADETLVFQLTVTDNDNAINIVTTQVVVIPAQAAQTYYVLNPNVNNRSLDVVSLTDNNTIIAGNTTLVLNVNESGSIPTSDLDQGTAITGSGNFEVGSDENATDMLAPAQFAGTEFVIPHYRNSHTYYLLSPNIDATAIVTINGSPATVSLTQGVVSTFNAGSDNTISGIVTADQPILVSHISGSNDVYTVPPVANELVGIRSNNVFVGALEDGTSITITTSSGSSQNYSLNRGDRLNPTVGSRGSEGAGNAYHIVSNKPIAAVQGADSDGYEETAFWSPTAFATQYALPIDTQYIAVSCLSNVTVTLTDGGSTSANCNGDGTTPGKVYFGSTSDGVRINAGATLESTGPIYVMYEAAGQSDEHNLLGNVAQ